MKTLFTFLFLGISTASAQGLNAEQGMNNTYHQQISAVLTDDAHMYYGIRQFHQNTFFSPSYIHCVDTNGISQWETLLSLPAEGTSISGLIKPNEDELFVWGMLILACDVVEGSYWFLQKMQSDGELLWNKVWHFENDYPMSEVVTILQNVQLVETNEYVLTFSTQDSSALVFMDGNGTISDSLELPFGELIGAFSVNDSMLVSYTRDSIITITNETQFEVLPIANPIRNVVVYNDSIFVLTNQELMLYDVELNLLNITMGLGYPNLSDLKLINDSLWCLTDGTTDDYLLTFDFNLNLIEAKPVDNHINNAVRVDYNEKHLAVGENFNLTSNQSVRVRDFSLESDEDAIVNRTDVALVDVIVYESSTQWDPAQPFIVYLNCSALALVRNDGPNTLDKVTLNHLVAPWGICNPDYYVSEFSDLNLASGDSMWIDMGGLGMHTKYLPTVVYGAPIDFDICVYSSNPNGVVDLTVPNDSFCKNHVFGYLETTENEQSSIRVYPNPVRERLFIDGVSPDSDASYKVMNATGKLLDHGTFVTNDLHVENLKEGLYFLVIEDAGKASCVKFTKVD